MFVLTALHFRFWHITAIFDGHGHLDVWAEPSAGSGGAGDRPPSKDGALTARVDPAPDDERGGAAVGESADQCQDRAVAGEPDDRAQSQRQQRDQRPATSAA